jgi:hypothetical protein
MPKGLDRVAYGTRVYFSGRLFTICHAVGGEHFPSSLADCRSSSSENFSRSAMLLLDPVEDILELLPLCLIDVLVRFFLFQAYLGG